jgi:endonuclease YncB( thermonuclease family)
MWRLLLLFLLLAAPAVARPFDARVLRVKDGDSVVVERVPQRRVMEIRLAGIDAPEMGQPWGIQSRDALRRMIGGKTVRVEVTDRDRYGRHVGRMWVGRTYVNAEMTRLGHAWAFARYLPDAEIRAGHEAARAAGRGLWSLPPADRLPPPTWRQRNPRAPQPE